MVKNIRDSVQLLVLPPDLSPAALEGFVRVSYLCTGYLYREPMRASEINEVMSNIRCTSSATCARNDGSES